MTAQSDPMTRSNLSRRVVTALILFGILCIVSALAHYTCFGKYLFTSLQLLMTGMCAYELGRICDPENRLRRCIFSFLALLPAFFFLLSIAGEGICAGGLSPANALGRAGAGVGIAAFFTAIASMLIGRSAIEESARIFRSVYPGLLLVGFGGACWIAVPLFQDGLWHFLWFVCVVCFNDIAAYFVGSRVGGPKLAPAISPKKTISGSVGGFVAGMLSGWVLTLILPVGYQAADAMLLGVVVVLFAQCGDLLKSYLKRLSDMKDSGTLLPGHGGFLDRLDGILFSAPFICAFLSL